MRNYRDERQRLRILKEHRDTIGDICPGSPWCQPDPHQTPDLTVDHILPQAHGGTLDHGWRVLCRTANSRRGDNLNTPNNTPPLPASRPW